MPSVRTGGGRKDKAASGRRLRWSEKGGAGREGHDAKGFAEIQGSEDVHHLAGGGGSGPSHGASDSVRKAAYSRADGIDTAGRRRNNSNKSREDDALRRMRRQAALEAQWRLGPLPDMDDVGSSDTDSTYSVYREGGFTVPMPGAHGTTYGHDFASGLGAVGGSAAVPHAPVAMTSVLLGGNGAHMVGESETTSAQKAALHAAQFARRDIDPRDLAKARKAALRQVGSSVQPMGLPFVGHGTGHDYGDFEPGSGFPGRAPGPKRGGLGRVTGASGRAVPGAFETESQRQARLMEELLGDGPGPRPDTKERSRRVQESALAGALRVSSTGGPVGTTETARSYGRGGLGGSLGDGTQQAGRFRGPRSELLIGKGGFGGTTTAHDAAQGAGISTEGLNTVGHKGPGNKSLRPGRVVPLMEGYMQARRVRLFDDDGAHIGRTTIRTPGQALEARVRRADRDERRVGHDGLPLGASLSLAQTALVHRKKAALGGMGGAVTKTTTGRGGGAGGGHGGGGGHSSHGGGYVSHGGGGGHSSHGGGDGVSPRAAWGTTGTTGPEPSPVLVSSGRRA